MANSADPDQLASVESVDLHCLQRQGISGFSGTRVKDLKDFAKRDNFYRQELASRAFEIFQTLGCS